MKRRILTVFLLAAMCLFMLSATSPISTPMASVLSTEDTSIVASPRDYETVDLLSGYIYTFVSEYERLSAAQYANMTDQYFPTPARLTWTCEDGAQYYTVKLSRLADLSDAAYFVTFDRALEIEDLYMGTTYYYQILAHHADKTVRSQVFAFQTAYLPRTVEIEGISNTRDMGGYRTESCTHRIRQGLVYRGGQTETITEAGMNKFLYTYGIRTDLDLRGEAKTPFGPAVNFVSVSAPYYVTGNGILNMDYREALITEIKTFADPSNYPIYVHCSLGRDRTGTICALINALCDVREHDLYLDYEISFFSERGCIDGASVESMVNGSFTSLFHYLNTYPTEKKNATLADRTEAFMKEELGITQAEIDSIRAILLEEVAKG